MLTCGLCNTRPTVLAAAIALVAVHTANTQQPVRFGGTYAELDSRRQQLVQDWVARFTKLTGQKLEIGPFYDEILSLSSKTTFDAVTHALLTTVLTDAAGARLGDALALVEHVESVRGEVAGAASDRQFRMYVRLAPGAQDMLERSQEFKRGADNSVYHKGYPLNYRQQGGVPSIQISIAQNGRRADIDVDYRSASFPAAMFNGHLSASNSDVRAGNNSDRHANRWAGFENWWRSFFGVRLTRAPQDQPTDSALAIPTIPRAGRKTIDAMVDDFLTAWLVQGDVMAAMGYVSERAYSCLALDSDEPADFDRGMAPFRLLMNLRAAHDALGKHTSLEGLVVGVRLTNPALRVVRQPHHAQFVVYSVPDDVAAAFDCGSRLMLGDPSKARRVYGNYFGATFYINDRKDYPLALLWARENGYWKVVSWQSGAEDRAPPDPEPPPDSKVIRIKADLSLVQAAHGFLESWLIRNDYDAAFRYLSTRSYGCYDLVRSPDQPASTSPADAGQKIRAALERSGQQAGKARSLDELIEAAEPVHPLTRVMDHVYSRTFTLASIPSALADAVDCATRARGQAFTGEVPLEYGQVFAMNIRFRTRGGDAPVLRILWVKEDGAWRITAYDVELP